MVKVLNKNVLLQAEVRDFKHSRGPPVRHMVSQFKGTEGDDDHDDDVVLHLVSQSKGEMSTSQSMGLCESVFGFSDSCSRASLT